MFQNCAQKARIALNWDANRNPPTCIIKVQKNIKLTKKAAKLPDLRYKMQNVAGNGKMKNLALQRLSEG